MTTTNAASTTLDLLQDVAGLAVELINIESVSGNEAAIAGAVEHSLRALGHLEVLRDGNVVMARTSQGRAERVILAGHLDTVPLPTVPGSLGTVPAVVKEGVIHGRGTTDMKGGVAIQLQLAAMVSEPARDVTYVFYDNEEVDSHLNGLAHAVENHPDWFDAQFAVLLEPSNGVVEGGCNGSLQAVATVKGASAHSARAWMGSNAIHGLTGILAALSDYQPEDIEVDGLVYKESLNAVRIGGGIAQNVIPDHAEVEVNYRYAPDKDAAAAAAVVRRVLAGFDVEVTDAMDGARPGLTQPAARDFVAAVGGAPNPKYGWTDVARFTAMGIPAVNYGPGDPTLAHTDNEHVAEADIRTTMEVLLRWLQG